jgi:hypothetical protein
MSFPSDHKVPVTDLVHHWGTNQQTVSALIGHAKRMTADGAVAELLGKFGYSQDALPSWFGSTAKAEDDPAKNAGADADPAEIAYVPAEGAGEDAETVYLPQEQPPIEQVPPGGQILAGADANARNARSAEPLRRSATQKNAVAITADQMRLLAQHGVTYACMTHFHRIRQVNTCEKPRKNLRAQETCQEAPRKQPRIKHANTCLIPFYLLPSLHIKQVNTHHIRKTGRVIMLNACMQLYSSQNKHLSGSRNILKE